MANYGAKIFSSMQILHLSTDLRKGQKTIIKKLLLQIFFVLYVLFSLVQFINLMNLRRNLTLKFRRENI